MPNWVQNEVIFENASDKKVAALIRELKLTIESEDHAIDFNKLVPMPESLNITDGTITDFAIAYYVTDRLTIPFEQTNLRDLISNCFSDDWPARVISDVRKDVEVHDAEYSDMLYAKGKQYMYNYEHYGCYTWYEWCCQNWGTKWNACEDGWVLDNGMLVFQTAWSAPFPVIEALAQKYPDLEFTHRWADEDIGINCGQMRYSNGCGRAISMGDVRAFALDVWGYTEDDFDDEDGYDGYEELEEEKIEVEPPETVDSGLSIFGLI